MSTAGINSIDPFSGRSGPPAHAVLEEWASTLSGMNGHCRILYAPRLSPFP